MIKKIEHIIIFIFLTTFTLITLFPILNVISISLRTDNAFQSNSLSIITKSEPFQDLNNNNKFDKGEPYEDVNKNFKYDQGSSLISYKKLFTETKFLTWLKNSILISTITTIFGVILASFGGYALSRSKFIIKSKVMLGLLITQMFPATMLLLPFFIILSKINLINSYLGLIIIYSSTALPFCLWQMKGFYDTIPYSIEESAILDGCSKWLIFYKIIIPLSYPALVITALFSFMASWSEYIIAAIILQDPNYYTLPLGLKMFQSSLSTQWGLYAAGAIIVSIPVIVIFITLSKYLVSGLTLGSVKE